MRKIYLTLDNLYDFYVSLNKTVKFNSQESGKSIVVQVPATIKKCENNDTSDSVLVPVHLKACHTGENRNKSYIEDSKMKSKLSTFKNKPILAYIHTVDGVEEFGGHEMHEKDGEMIYDEIPVGTIPESCNAELKYDEDKDKNYVHVDGYLYGQYNHSAQILERMGGEAKVSVELNVFELSFDAKNKTLNIEDFEFSGITILGVDKEGNEIGEGMEGANITFADFSAENNSFINSELLEEVRKLNATLSSININSSLKEGGKSEMKFEEILAKFGKTFDDIDFDYENMSEEEFELKLNELFGEVEETPSEDEEDSENFEESEEESEEKEEAVEFEEEVDETGGAKEETEENFEAKDEVADNVYATNYSINYSDGSVKTFAVSLNDTIQALSTLVNDTYAESDNAWYSVVVYDSYVVMADYWNEKYYKQTYKKRKDVYSLTGDRVSVYPTFCTQEELDNLDTMRSNYSLMESKLQEYQNEENEKQIKEVFNSLDYASIQDNPEYLAYSQKVLKDCSNYTLQEVIDECDKILNAVTKVKNREIFAESHKEDNKDNKVIIPMFESKIKSNKKSRYGNLFSKK